jgi:prophage regulatory protein
MMSIMTINAGQQLADSASPVIPAEYLSAQQLEELTGTPASTWRYWAHIGSGPTSFRLGRRRLWRRQTVLTWLEDLEKTGSDLAAELATMKPPPWQPRCRDCNRLLTSRKQRDHGLCRGCGREATDAAT